MSDTNDNQKPNRTPPNSPATLNKGTDRVLLETTNPASDPTGGSGGGNCPDQQDDTTEKPKEDSDMVAPEGNPPPGHASDDGGDNRAGQDHFMKEVLEEGS